MSITAYNLPKRLTDALKGTFGKEVMVKSKISKNNIDKNCEIAVLSINSSLKSDALSAMPKLKAIVTASAGMDHIDLEECKRRGIEVKNCPTYSSNGVAELAIALAFTGLRDLGRMLGFGRSLAYPPTCFYYIGSELAGKKCAVLGTGAIGVLIAKKLLALGCRVIAFSRSENKELVDLGVVYLSMEEALKEADIAFVALPSTPQTYHILADKELSMLKDGAALVNIARGELIDSEALVTHIDRFAFVASDVIEGEAALWLGRPMKVKAVEELSKKKNFFLVPHIGASTKEAQDKLTQEVLSAVAELMQKDKS